MKSMSYSLSGRVIEQWLRACGMQRDHLLVSQILPPNPALHKKEVSRCHRRKYQSGKPTEDKTKRNLLLDGRKQKKI